MGGAGFLVVKNFERFQHYKDRAVMSWIKLYASLLTDYDFQALPDKSKAHLMLIWLLVSQRNDRRIPNDARWIAQKIGATDRVELAILIEKGWLLPLEVPYQREKESVPRVDKNREEEIRSDQIVSSGFDDFYLAYPRHEAKADAWKAWRVLNPDADLLTTIAADLHRYDGKDRQFVPLPASYLRGRRWEDDRPIVPERQGNFGNTGMANLARHLGESYGQNGNGKTPDAGERELVSPADRRPDHRDVERNPKAN